MTMPSQEAQRSRETAMQAERHWWVERLQEHIQWLERWQTPPKVEIQILEALIAERTK